MKKHYRKENDCLNCGTLLEGKFCHNCGQENLQMKESFGHMLNHAVSDYFHFDDQFFHTIKPLLFSPGKLTNEYLLGRRAQYLHPVKMYIFISLIFFLFAIPNNKNDVIVVKGDNESVSKKPSEIKKEILTDINKDKSLTPAQKAAVTKKISPYIPGADNKAIKDTLNNKVKTKSEDNEAGFTMYGDDNDGKTYEEYLAKQQKISPAKRDNFIEKYLKKKSFDWKSHGKNAREMFFEAFKHNVPKIMFLLLPLVALILKIAFRKNKKFYVEHIIYVIHLHCFLFLVLTFKALLQMTIPESWGVMSWIVSLVGLFIMWYIYQSLKVVYHRSAWRTVSKMIGVSFMYLFVFTFCFCLILAITAITSI